MHNVISYCLTDLLNCPLVALHQLGADWMLKTPGECWCLVAQELLTATTTKFSYPGLGGRGETAEKSFGCLSEVILMIANVQLQLSVFLINILANLRSGR